jgi:hypothetical protein
MPSIFDNAVKTCADYASTAVPIAYQPLANLEGFCESLGDVDTPPMMFTLSSMYQLAEPTGSGFSGQPCNSVNTMLNDCSSLTPGFSSLQPQDQAKCLCYVSSSSWCPTAFDNAVATCAGYAQTAEPSVYGTMSALGGFCADIGNVLVTTPASYSVPTTLSAVPSPTLTSGPTSTTKTSSGEGGPTSTTETGIMITIGGAGLTSTGAAKSGVLGHERASVGEVVGVSLLCSLILLFL